MSRPEKTGLDQAFLKTVARILQRLDRHINQYVARRLAQNNIHMDVASGLSPRERQVFRLILQGLTNKQIAAQLGISARTAKFHVSSVLKKFGARNRLDVFRGPTQTQAILRMRRRD